MKAPKAGHVARSLADLRGLRDDLARRQAEAERARVLALEQARALERERRLFADSVGPVKVMAPSAPPVARRAPPPPEPRQRQLDEQAALRASIEDGVDVESLLLTDDGLSYRRPAVPSEVVLRLRRGEWAIQAELDLHGLRRDEARERLAEFIRLAVRQGSRCVRVVHGKGIGSPGREPVLKGKVQRWLARQGEVMAFTQARGVDGGNGALIVLLEA